VQRRKINREGKQTFSNAYDTAVAVAVKLSKAIEKIPYSAAICMEDMRAVTVYFDPANVFTVAVAADVRAAIDHQNSTTSFRSASSKDATEHADADDDVVKLGHFAVSRYSLMRHI
jgi:hypothetical protein